MDPHQWRSTPYQPQTCPVCLSLHFPFCPPSHSCGGGAHFQPHHPYPSPPPPPKRMRVDGPYSPHPPDHSLNQIVSKEERILSLIRDHGRQTDPQDPGIGSYQNYHVQFNGYNNPYTNPYSISQDVSQSYRPVHSYASTSVHADAYYGYNQVENGYGYQSDPVHLCNLGQVAPAPAPPPPPPQVQPPPLPPLPHNPSDFVLQKNGSIFPVMSSGSGRTVPVPVPVPLPPCVYGLAETTLPHREAGSVVYPPSVSEPIMNARVSVNSIPKPISAQLTVVNACDLFKHPHRASRPDHFVVILRGLPGSGKSYLAKALRDVEVENGGSVPRIHSMDDYFMIEVEKDIEDGEGSKSRSKKLTKKVIEYCYEAEMEETYRSSMLKAFKKTLDEGNFTFVIEVGL